MELDNSVENPPYFTEKHGSEVGTDQGVAGDGHPILNGYTNGISENHIQKEHKSEHKEKSRDKERDREKDKDRHKDRDRERDRDKDRDRHKEKHKDKDRERDRDKHKHSSSSSKDKDKHSSSKDKEREKDKHKDHKSSSSSSNKDRESDRDKEKSRDKDKERDRDKDKSKEHKSSSSSSKDKDKHSSSKDKDRDREKDRDKDKIKSSSSHKDKDKSSSSKDKDKHHSSSSSTKDRDKHKDGGLSSSNKDKRSGSDKDKHRDKDKYKEKEKEREKDRDKEKKAKDKDRDHEHRKIKTEPPKEDYESQAAHISEPVYEKEPEKIKTEPDIDIKYEPIEDVDIKHEPIEEPYVDGNSSQDSALSQHSLKIDVESDDDVPLMQRATAVVKKEKRKQQESDEDDIPLTKRKKVKKAPQKRKAPAYDEEEEDFKPAKKKKKAVKAAVKAEVPSPKKTKKGQEEPPEVWKWWEEDKREDGVKWNFLEHKGPVFAPPYEPLPDNVKFFYDGKEMKLSEGAEEVAGFYARMLEHDYTTKEVFNKNFFKDWRKQMTEKERGKITDLKKCDFTRLHVFYKQQSEDRKNMSKEEKKKIKEKNEEMMKEYGVCAIDGHQERIGNFKIEPPGLFRGRGEHPKMGMLKRRVVPEDVIINCSKDSQYPQAPDGRKWKEVRHDNSVTWLACWVENVQSQTKYVMLNPSSKLKGEKDWQKYETARKLAKSIDKIRENYKNDWKSKEMRIRQRAVALYFIDKLALRAGNEKDEDQADTVGCCSLRVEHITLHEEKDGKQFVVEFDFLGKDSIRYYNAVPVEKRVFKNLQLFMENKAPGDDLFDRLNTGILNKHLNELMEGLTAKVFRTYNASITLQQQLDQLTDPDDSMAAKILSYNRANRAVAILCNHQRAVPKTHAKSMENLQNKIAQKREQVEEAERQLKIAKKEVKYSGSTKDEINFEKKKKALERLRDSLMKLEVSATDKEENKEIALGTSKLNYLDPRISVAWCKKYNVDIGKIYNKTQRDKFRWAIDMAGADYIF